MRLPKFVTAITERERENRILAAGELLCVTTEEIMEIQRKRALEYGRLIPLAKLVAEPDELALLRTENAKLKEASKRLSDALPADWQLWVSRRATLFCNDDIGPALAALRALL